MELIDQTREGLLDYTSTQICHFFPDGRADAVRRELDRHLDDALARTGTCIDAVRMWQPGKFSHLHSTQYCLYLYFLANTLWRAGGDTRVATRLFLLNKTLNGIDLFYEVEMPDVFFIGHSVGIVLAKATYGSHLVLYQNSTVGKNHGVAPVIEPGVVMYPNTAIIGRSHIGRNAVLSQGVSVVNRDVPPDQLVFAGADRLIFKPNRRDILADIFRL
ncbi:hypothetical protein [Jeongeupia sp. USM3]|uniref:hypothetical protein n=1 Tax=Jeongeupia sp. USM3 TaxID=1906741 RepID=UPI00089DE3AB|nr:hypothetical protein [Jeongeupia sp. USM3]AOX99301.1 hypothetical protein BJP62_01835 [Jeongeupia sp. USM3]